MAIKTDSHRIRFMMTGATSTSIDFGILFLLHSFFGVPSIVANFFSTGIAFCFSFFLNRHFTFRAHGGDAKRQFILFFVTTFFGIWLIQPIIIGLITHYLEHDTKAWVGLLVAKFVATSVTLMWNYFCYSRIVFPTHHRE